jgi:hypothetical protein
MPMDFPDMESLEQAAEVWKFRKPNEGETEPQYRNALADHVSPKDIVESMEIRTGRGWDQFSAREGTELVLRSALQSIENKRK